MNFEPASPRASTGSSGGPSPSPSSRSSASNSSLRAQAQTQRHLRASRFADISADRRSQSVIPTLASLSITYAPFALGAFAIASALATQRLLGQLRDRRHPALCGPAEACRVTFGGRSCGRPCGRPCGHPCGRIALSRKGGFSRAWRRLLALRFADISTSQQGRCGSSMRSRYLPLLFAASPGIRTIASALAPQRFSAKPRRHGLGAAWCGAVVVPLVACLAMARRGEGCPESRRPRARAHSARVMAVHRKEVDLDRFVAALLALAAEPGAHSGRRHKTTGESSRTEQSCRR